MISFCATCHSSKQCDALYLSLTNAYSLFQIGCICVLDEPSQELSVITTIIFRVSVISRGIGNAAYSQTYSLNAKIKVQVVYMCITPHADECTLSCSGLVINRRKSPFGVADDHQSEEESDWWRCGSCAANCCQRRRLR